MKHYGNFNFFKEICFLTFKELQLQKNNNNKKIKNYICNTNTPKSEIPVNLTTTAL